MLTPFSQPWSAKNWLELLTLSLLTSYVGPWPKSPSPSSHCPLCMGVGPWPKGPSPSPSPHIDSLSIAPQCSPVHGGESFLPSEVDMSSSRQQGHNAMNVAIAATGNTKGCVYICGEKTPLHILLLFREG